MNLEQALDSLTRPLVLAVTGPEKPPLSGREAVHHRFASLDPELVGEVRTGAAFGIDTSAFFAGLRYFPDARHRVFVPRGYRYNEDVVLYAKQEGHEVIGIDGGYLKRDDALIEYDDVPADVLYAFPQTMTEVLRSGTWSTVRRAWKKDVVVRFTPLDGKRGPVVRCT